MTENRIEFSRAEAGEMGNYWMDTEWVSVAEKVLEMMVVMVAQHCNILNASQLIEYIKMIKIVNFMFCIFHNKNF